MFAMFLSFRCVKWSRGSNQFFHGLVVASKERRSSALASAQIVATPRCFLLHLNRKKEIIYFLKSELLKGTVRFFRDGKTLPSPLPLSVTANNYTILRLFPLQQSLDIIINVLRRICNPVAGGWMVVGDLYDGRPRSLSRLAAGTSPGRQSIFQKNE